MLARNLIQKRIVGDSQVLALQAEISAGASLALITAVEDMDMEIEATNELVEMCERHKEVCKEALELLDKLSKNSRELLGKAVASRARQRVSRRAIHVQYLHTQAIGITAGVSAAPVLRGPRTSVGNLLDDGVEELLRGFPLQEDVDHAV